MRYMTYDRCDILLYYILYVTKYALYIISYILHITDSRYLVYVVYALYIYIFRCIYSASSYYILYILYYILHILSCGAVVKVQGQSEFGLG